MISDSYLLIEEALNVPNGSSVMSSNWVDLAESIDIVQGEPLALVINFENGSRPTSGAGGLGITLVTSNDGSTPSLMKGGADCFVGKPDPTNPSRQVYPSRFIIPLPENGCFERYMTVQVSNGLGQDVDLSLRLVPLSMAMNIMHFENTYRTRQTI